MTIDYHQKDCLCKKSSIDTLHITENARRDGFKSMRENLGLRTIDNNQGDCFCSTSSMRMQPLIQSLQPMTKVTLNTFESL